MEGEKILKSLLNRQTEGLYKATDVYLSPLRKVFERKNGFKASDSKSSEEAVSKYCSFCAKYLRCVVEALKKCDGTGRELEQITSSMKIVTKILDTATTYDNGKYLRLVPSLDQLGRTLFHIVDQLLNKSHFSEAMDHANCLLKCIQLTKRSTNNINLSKDVTNLAQHALKTLWKGANKMEQPQGQSAKVQVGIVMVLQCRMLALKFASEGNLPIKSHVDHILTAATKFQKDSKPSSINSRSLSDFMQDSFQTIAKRTEGFNHKHKVDESTLHAVTELGFHCGRVCQKSGRILESLAVFTQLQEIIGRLATSSHGRSLLQTYTCICLACQAAVSLNSDMECSESQGDGVEAVDEVLHGLNEKLTDVQADLKGLSHLSLELLSDTLEFMRSSIQKACNKQVDRCKNTDNSKKGRPSLPHRTFDALQQVFSSYVELLEWMRQSLPLVGEKCGEVAKKAMNRQLAALIFMTATHLEQIQQCSCTGAVSISNKSRPLHLATGCLCLVQQRSDLVHSMLLANPEVSISVDELKWLAFDAYNLGCLCYKSDWFDLGAALLSLACQELSTWCFAGNDGTHTIERMEQVKLFSKYSLLADCQRRGGCYSEALGMLAESVVLVVRAGREFMNDGLLTAQVKLWTSTKNEFIKQNEDRGEAEAMKTRTLLNGLAELDNGSHITQDQLAQVLEQELACYKSKRYNTDVEQATVARQLVELYAAKQDWPRHAGTTLELALATCQADARGAAELCQSAVECLQEALPGAESDADAMFVREKLATAHAWCAVLRHQSAVQDNSKAKCDSDTVPADEQTRVSGVVGSVVGSLESALELWEAMVGHWSLKRGGNEQIDVSLIHSPEEMCFHLKTVAALFDLLGQPLSSARALHLTALLHQAGGSASGLDAAVVSYSRAAHALCRLGDVPHAEALLQCGTRLLAEHDASPAANVEFLLSKGHSSLISGKFLEGESFLREAFASQLLSHKTATAHFVHGRLDALNTDYLMLPPSVHELGLPADPDLGRASPLDVALDGLHKFRQLADEFFGPDFNGAHSTTGTTAKPSTLRSLESGAPSAGARQHGVQSLSVLCELLCACARVGQLYVEQGAAKEALTHLTDGLQIATRYCLPHRVGDFLTSMVHLDLQQGNLDEAAMHLGDLRQVLGLPVTECGDRKTSSASRRSKKDTMSLVKHSEACRDLSLRILHVRYSLALSRYLAQASQLKQSISALEVTDGLCASAETLMAASLESLTQALELGRVSDANTIAQTKTTKPRASRGRKQKGVESGARGQAALTARCIFGQFSAAVHALNADVLIQSGKLVKARELTAGALEDLGDVVSPGRPVLVSLFPRLAKLYYLSGLTAFLSVACPESDRRWSLCPAGPESVGGSGTEASSAEEPSAVIKAQRATRRGPTKSANANAPGSKTRSTAAQRKERVSTRGRRTRAADEGAQQLSKETATGKGSARPIHEGPCELDKAAWSLERALELFQPLPPPALFSRVCQLLALCNGRRSPEVAASYLHLSTGVTLRHQAVAALGKRIRKLVKDSASSQNSEAPSSGSTARLPQPRDGRSLGAGVCAKLSSLRAVRESMLWPRRILDSQENHDIARGLPEEWTVCSLAVVSLPGEQGRQLVLSQLRADCEPILLKVAIDTPIDESEKPLSDVDDMDSIAMNFTKLFEGTIDEEFESIMSDSSRSMEQELSRQEWWGQRTRLDKRMKRLLRQLEDSWLGPWKGVLLGRPADPGSRCAAASAALELSHGIQAVVGRAPDGQLLQVLFDSYPHLTKSQLRRGLTTLTGCDAASATFAEVLDLFETAVTKASTSEDESTAMKRPEVQAQRHPVILILDKAIQQLPWESLPVLRDQAVSRVPSLQFLHSQLQALQVSEGRSVARKLDPVSTYYILNPQTNLANTQKMFQDWFESEAGWEGVSGKAPSHAEFSSALVEHDMFIYLGHGTGREFLKGHDIQRLDCRAASLLMGCSSGKLQSNGDCEPTGMVLNYLLAGCPAVVANLWDVTDRDIDRFSEKLLKVWLQSRQGVSLLHVVSRSRRACKMPFLIGAAPVVYGIPVYLKE